MAVVNFSKMKFKQKIAVNSFKNKFGEGIELQEGVHKTLGAVLYLIVRPKSKEDILSCYLLDKKSYKLGKKICGCITNYDNKKNNSRCVNYSGWGKHKGIGYCRKHKKSAAVENKFTRKYMSEFFQTGRGKAPIYINLLKALEEQPFETENQLIALFNNLLASFVSQLQGMSHYKELRYVEKNGKKRKLSEEELSEGRGQSFVDDYKAIMAYTKQLESLANSIANLRREIHFSPTQIFKWLDEGMIKLEGIFGTSIAQEAIYNLVTVKGLLNKTELKEGVVIDATFMEKEKSLLAALPLGYASRIDDANFEDVINGEKNE